MSTGSGARSSPAGGTVAGTPVTGTGPGGATIEPTGPSNAGSAHPDDLPAPDSNLLASSPAVRRWLEAIGAAPDEDSEPLRLLARFCASQETGPDELIARCLRSTAAGSTAISAPGRRSVDRAVTAFVAAEGLTGHDAVVAGNRIRGFLIHNGIFLQGRPSIG